MELIVSKGITLLILFIMYALGYWSGRSFKTHPYEPQKDGLAIVYGWALVGVVSMLIEF